jgi:hypothetical protein
MRTTPEGYKVPQTNDAGNVWAKAIEDDIDKLDLLENKVNNLTSGDITRSTTFLDKANWDVETNGKGYIQTVSLPAGSTMDKVVFNVRITSGPRIHQVIHPTINPLSITAYEIVVNDSTLDLEVLYA